MTPTKVRTLALTALISGLVTYLLFRAFYSDLPPLPWTAALSTFLLALAEAFAAPMVRARLAGRPGTKPILPMAVARTAALAKASSALGAVMLGAWAGVAGYVVPRMERAVPRDDAVDAAVGAGAALLLIGAALWLENVCRVKHPPPGDPPPAEGGP